MHYDIYFQLLGGLGFFLFGIKFMSEALRKVSSERLKNILAHLTKRRVVALLVGAGLTALIQSSSAMTVMVVGFVNASLLTLRQAIPVILGANIGTTFTAWIVSFFAIFKITTYALPAVGIGFILMTVSKNTRSRQWGEVLFGFGVLFVGIGFMKDAFMPLESSEKILKVMVTFSRYPILGVLVGTIITMVLQSSSATIALVQLLAFRGLIDFPSAIPLILGDNIGTTITAQIARIGGTTGAKRVAWAHTLFNVIGVAYMLVFVQLGLYHRAIEAIVPGLVTSNNIMLHIALSHSIFNCFNAALFLPLSGWLQRLVERVVKRKGDELLSAEPRYLEPRLLETPPLALEQSKKEILRMLHIADSALGDAMKLFFDGAIELERKVHRKEDAVDNLQAEITRYLINISMEGLEREEAEMIPVFIHTVNDIERISDQSENIVELGLRLHGQKLPLTASAVAEMKRMADVAHDMLNDVALGLQRNDADLASHALEHEDRLNRMQITLRQNHVDRLGDGTCNMLSGLVFLDFVDCVEKIGDHLANVAQSLISGLRWEAPEHEEPDVESILEAE
ncbi:MAG: Na/Pi cotransporter family protein [Candidatus Krumholzibacteriota bacterium]|nr:Na/Pi cotransporter family protein [Candidatus Krumholzibacteriota bacterium]